jgi:hypothetical protein
LLCAHIQRGAYHEISDRYGGRFRESLIEKSAGISSAGDSLAAFRYGRPKGGIASARLWGEPTFATPRGDRHGTPTTLEARHLSKTISLPFSVVKPMRHFLTLEI